MEELIRGYIESSEPILIACFSKNGDKLSQWRSYGQDGYGVAIGFGLDKIKLIKDEGNNILVKYVIYKEERQVKELLYLVK